MGGKMSRDKGKRGEREVVDAFEKEGFRSFRMAPMQAGLSTEFPDVSVNLRTNNHAQATQLIKFLIESKNMEITPNFEKIWNEGSMLDAVVHKKNHQRRYITMTLDGFIGLLLWAGVQTHENEGH